MDGERVRRERWLREAVLAGDAGAWRGWYEESYPTLEAYVRWRCAGLHDLAEDVLQETWMTAVRSVRRFRPEAGSFAGWLAGIAANVLRNQLRSRCRRARRQQRLADGAAVALPDAAPSLPDGERVARALATLPERYERVLRAKYLDRRGIAE